MTRTVADAERWARAHVTTPGSPYGFADGRDWYGMSQALMYRACALANSADTAHHAWEASKGYGHWPDAVAAPRGAFHWWSTGAVGPAGPQGVGHVALDLDSGGTRCLMASTYLCGGEEFHPGGYYIGTQSVARYTALSDHVYVGWTLNFMGSRVADVRMLSAEYR